MLYVAQEQWSFKKENTMGPMRELIFSSSDRDNAPGEAVARTEGWGMNEDLQAARKTFTR